MIMRPTTMLRFVERNGHRVLQQLWLSDDASLSEWRDVPLVEDEYEPRQREVREGSS